MEKEQQVPSSSRDRLGEKWTFEEIGQEEVETAMYNMKKAR